jgi:hypothetical protein
MGAIEVSYRSVANTERSPRTLVETGLQGAPNDGDVRYGWPYRAAMTGAPSARSDGRWAGGRPGQGLACREETMRSRCARPSRQAGAPADKRLDRASKLEHAGAS